MNLSTLISQELNIPINQVAGTVNLLDDGATIPFISRYRKEATGSLDDDVLRGLGEKLEFYRALERAGVTVLRNEAVLLGMGEGFRLIGVDCNPARTDALRELMADRPAEELNVLLSHKPHYAKYYEQAGVDLVFTGHAHGGQFRLPGVGALFAPGQGPLPKYTAGMYRLGKTVMCVSRGLGNSSFPLRVENKPELVTVILRGAHC